MITTLDQHKTEKTTHRAFIRGLLLMHNVSGRSIAKAHGFTESYISKILAGVKKNRTVQQYIADVLGIPFDELWNIKQ